MKIRRKLEFFYVWFKHVFLKVKLPLRTIELVEKHFKATESEKKLIEKIKKINSNQNKMEQTAVEWLEEQIAFRNDYEKLLPIYNEDFDLSKFFNKAKKM